ncbi:MAG: ATP-binding protein [Thermodesulfobacteriota bacterium]
MPSNVLNLPEKESQAGFRLKRLEMYNWGTFHRDVWKIAPAGFNSLLTGDIGSGKSTVVDAVTTLLVPHHRIVYNKAAGAEGKERSLYSYIRGEYKSVKMELGESGKPVALREDHNSYTVLLGHFAADGRKPVTLAQVFWLKDQNRNPERFFVVSESDLTIAEDFADFGTNILDLKKRLKKRKEVAVYENFKRYADKFRRLFGIENPQALELFYQTVSMKSVGNLTDFVRRHMLDETDVESRIVDIRKNFDNLNQAHAAVLRAKDQIERLSPLVADGREHEELRGQLDQWVNCREALQGFFAVQKETLLKEAIGRWKLDHQNCEHRLETLRKTLAELRDTENDLKNSIADNGGRRLEELAREIARRTGERDQKREREKAYLEKARRLKLPRPEKSETFFHNRKTTEAYVGKIDVRLADLQVQQVDFRIAVKQAKEESDRVREELDSLRKRKTNIPLKNLRIRREMAETLGLPETEMPFVGELLRVDERESEWEGAIERLLHNFGLSLLVPEIHYAQVSRYVDRTHLKGRLVYFRVREDAPAAAETETGLDDLIRKIQIKPDTPFYDWLFGELRRRFDFICCRDMAEFHRRPRAITPNGQIKTGGQRHEKDDRHDIRDRGRYILGWQNREKIRALKGVLADLEARGAKAMDELNALVNRQQSYTVHRDVCRDLLTFTDYAEIHWRPAAARIQELEAERKRIAEGSDLLRDLEAQREKVVLEIAARESDYDKTLPKRGEIELRLAQGKNLLVKARKLAATVDAAARKSLFPKLAEFQAAALGDRKLTFDNVDDREKEVRHHIQKKIDAGNKKLEGLTVRIIQRMQDYKGHYPAETSEVDAALEAGPEYAAMLKTLQEEDLPRHEARFKNLLNEGTINSIALFQSQLAREREEIEKKIDRINASLADMEYSPGTYIQLISDPAGDGEVRDFRTDLKQCLSQELDGTDLYNERKFLQVKKLIDRFNGREGLAELDRKWTRKVTDVRNWFVFSAAERWKEDDSEKEYYSDSSGKSGGQKEKLAYTILGSALAYQFGLDDPSRKSRSFRFVVIDEAFGRGSDDSTRYGLELFKRLDLQLLIVTPLQKINIIEDYIRAVHFVHNEGGMNSVLKNLTVEEYREEKAAYREGAQS